MASIPLVLDVERQLKWTMRSEFLLGSLPNPPSIADIGSKNPRKAFYALACHVWASVQGEHPFKTPEDLAEHLNGAEVQLAAIKAFQQTLSAAGIIKKKDMSKEASTTGPLPS